MEYVAIVFVVLVLMQGIIREALRIMFEAVSILLYPAKIALDVGQGAWWVGKKTTGILKTLRPSKGSAVYGDASWASQKVLKRHGHLNPGGFPIGKLNGKWVYTNPDKSLLMQAQTGAGKSLTMGASFISARGEDFLVYDPARQHWQAQGPALSSKGYRVMRIDLDDPAQAQIFDPAWFLEHSTVYTRERDLKTLAELLFPAGRGKGGEKDHFVSQVTMLAAGTLNYFLVHDRRKGNLAGVADALVTAPNDVREDMFKNMRAGASAALLAAINSYLTVGERERGSIFSTMTNALEVWTWTLYRRLCTWDGDEDEHWTFEDLWKGDQPFAMFVTGGMGARSDVRAFLRMLFGLCAQSRARAFENGSSFKRPMKMMIDEADNLGECMPVANIITELRKAKLQVFLAYQSISQLYDNFSKARADTILDNVDIISTGGIRNTQELKRLSDLLGQRTEKVSTEYSSGRGGKSESDVARPLASVDEIFRLPMNQLIALLGVNAAKLDRIWDIKDGVPVYR